MRQHERRPVRPSHHPGEGGVRRAPAAGILTERLLTLQRLAGNAAVTRALRQPTFMPPPLPKPNPLAVTVQRAAWVGGQRVDPAEAVLTPEMRKLAEDRDVHDYQDEDEFRRHTAGQTDYLGNLAHRSTEYDGTWIRFSPTGLNVIGENHGRVTLPDIVAAVGARSFIYEPFSVDDLSANPATEAASRRANAGPMAALGIGENDDVRPFAAESLFPKLGFAFEGMMPMMTPAGLGRMNGFIGERLQHYLVIAWAYAGEVRAEVEARSHQHGPAEVADGPVNQHLAEAKLAKFSESQQVLGRFVDGLRPNAELGTSVADWRVTHPDHADRLLAELREFGHDVIELIAERMSGDADLTTDDRADMKYKKGIDRFRLARDVKFRESVRAAHARGVRYAGMGVNHMRSVRTWLKPGNGINYYNFADGDVDLAKTLTRQRAKQIAR